MGKRGPAPTPGEILKLTGTWRSGKLKDEPKPKKARPDCARWINRDARAIYKRLAAILGRMGVLTEADGEALNRLSQLYSRLHALERDIEKHGLSYTTSQGGMGTRPEANMAAKLADQVLRLEQQFGLTPSARTQIHVSKEAQSGKAVKYTRDPRTRKSG